METEQYFKKLEEDVKKVYEVANAARAKGYDPVDSVEVPLAKTMTEKCVELIATMYPQMSGCGIDKRILELEGEYGKLDSTVIFKIAEEVARQKFCKFASLHDAIDAGIRVGFSYITLGVVASPIEGYTELKIEKTRDGKDYFKVYFSGPIRSAGTTASSFVLILIDYLREMFGFAKYDPTEEEIKRYVTECNDYHDRITNLQYIGTEEELTFLGKHFPIQIAGDPTERLEVSNYKNLDRVETNFIRGGMCLAFSEGFAQKAPKALRLLENAQKKGIDFKWDWLEEYLELHEKTIKAPVKKEEGAKDRPVYIKDLVAGRPVYGHPSRSGAFRFRYGRGRTSGFSGASLHPATMGITEGFIANGTQLKIEKPTKGCVVTSCDKIDGPIVKMFNGSVRKPKTTEEALKIYPDVEEILYLGDFLFPFSDVLNRRHDLLKPGYVEEWWGLELEKRIDEAEKKPGNVKKPEDYLNVCFEEAVELSREFEVPLYPKYIFYWTEISKGQFGGLIDWLKHARVSEGKLIFSFNKAEQDKFAKGKRALELIGIEHEVTTENVVLDVENSKAFFANLGLDLKLLEAGDCLMEKFVDDKKFELGGKGVLEKVNKVSEFIIKDKAGEFVGTRMGRPEKAKLRKLTGSPNVLFPIGKEGGRLRSANVAYEIGRVGSSFPIFQCKKCGKETIYPICEKCGSKAEQMFYCRECKEKFMHKCEEHESGNQKYCYQQIDMKNYFESAVNHLGLKKGEVPELIKGIRGTSSENHVMENFAKGILRAKHNLQVNKDGTIRYDGTEVPVSHFKPKEIGTSVEKLKKLGYDKDYLGKDLVDEEQIIELMPHDILLPACIASSDEKADDVFVKVCNFIDEELERFYGLKSFYNVKTREDLIGRLGVFMAPHNCAGVICRFIGFSNALGLYASPYMHAAVRRDCDGDEAAIMLLGDVLINFSREYLPGHRGGTQDAPLVLNGKIDAGEVDDQILDLEMIGGYPLSLYEKAEQSLPSSEVKEDEVPLVKTALKEGKNPFEDILFTHDTTNMNDGITCSSYKTLATMQEKVGHQMELVEKIRAVDTADVAHLVIDRHFLRDMRGNLRKFSQQEFRCVECNEIIRRVPLSGKCSKCGGKLIFTIHEGGIKKYLEPALDLAEKYNLSTYMKQNLALVKGYIDSIFGKELEKQEALGKWF